MARGMTLRVLPEPIAFPARVWGIVCRALVEPRCRVSGAC